MIKNKALGLTLVIYTVLFYAIWTVYGFVFAGMIDHALNDNVMIMLIRSGVIKNIVWTLPAIVLIVWFEDDMFANTKEMCRFGKKDLIGIPVMLCLEAYVFLGTFIRKHGLFINESFGLDKVIIVLFVGLTEELVFRGWLLNAFMKNADTDKKRYIAIGINAVMFLMIHFPVWITSGDFVNNITSLSFVIIIVLSLVFSYCFIKTKNIFVPIIIHSVYDLLVFMFV